MGEPKHFPFDEVYYRMGIWLEKCTHTMGKVRVPISQAFHRILLHFPMLWEIDRETHAFLIWWGIPQDWNLTGKKHPYYEKSMSTNFPGPPHTMDFIGFFCAIRNRWENPCISHVMKYTTGWKSNGKKALIQDTRYKKLYFW